MASYQQKAVMMSKTRFGWHHAGMEFRIVRRLMLSLLLLTLSGCAMASSKTVTGDLWQTWAGVDALVQTDYPDATPIVLVHGWNGGEFTWPDPKRLQELEQKLHRDIFYFTYRTGIVATRFPPLEVMEEQLERYLSGFKQVDIVAHSMGGLLIRQYLSHHPENNIRRVVFLSTPHFGTEAATFLVDLASVSPVGNLQAEELRAGSDYLWQLNSLDGAELESVQALNVFVEGSSFSDSDLVVDPASAWLPWAFNATVEGGHHTLAEQFGEFGFILDFLTDGTLPAKQAKMPDQRTVWLRVRGYDGKPLPHLLPTMIRRSSPSSVGHTHGVEVCCDLQSALHETARNTLVISEIKSDETVQLALHGVTTTRSLDVPAIMARKQPVQLQEINLAEPEPASGVTTEPQVDQDAKVPVVEVSPQAEPKE